MASIPGFKHIEYTPKIEVQRVEVPSVLSRVNHAIKRTIADIESVASYLKIEAPGSTLFHGSEYKPASSLTQQFTAVRARVSNTADGISNAVTNVFTRTPTLDPTHSAWSNKIAEGGSSTDQAGFYAPILGGFKRLQFQGTQLASENTNPLVTSLRNLKTALHSLLPNFNFVGAAQAVAPQASTKHDADPVFSSEKVNPQNQSKRWEEFFPNAKDPFHFSPLSLNTRNLGEKPILRAQARVPNFEQSAQPKPVDGAVLDEVRIKNPIDPVITIKETVKQSTSPKQRPRITPQHELPPPPFLLESGHFKKVKPGQ